MAEITVIVPVYKAEDYLSACIDSILAQTYSDFELVLVDDGSPDNCGAICEAYAKKDGRIRVLHQENQGQSAARNHALSQTKAPWVCFVDSDDLIHPKALELLYWAAKDSGAGISMCRMLESPTLPETFFGPVSEDYAVHTINDFALARMYESGTYPAWVSCGKLIRRELIETHFFVPGWVFEDNEAVCHWVAAAGTLAEIPENLYFYRTNPESTTKTGFNLKKLDFLWALENIVKFYGSIGFTLTYDRFFDRYIMECADHYRAVTNAMGSCEAAKAIQRNLRSMLKTEKWKLSKVQLEALLDAMHPGLIKLYWPIEGITRTLQEEGIKGIVRKLKNHLGGTNP